MVPPNSRVLLVLVPIAVQWASWQHYDVVVQAFSPSYHSSSSSRRPPAYRRYPTTALFDYSDDGAPSDYDSEDLLPDIKEVMVDEKVEDGRIRDELKRELLLLSSVTDRGAYATKEESDIATDLVAQLEALNPTADPAAHCEGSWDLCYDSSGQLFRSSPFFQEIRAAVGDDNKDVAQNFFNLHAAATIGSRIGRVRQIVTSERLISEVDLEVGMLPGIPMKAKGTVVTSASLKIVSDKNWDLQVDKTLVRGSNIPIFNQFMDDLQVELPVGEAYKTLQGNVPVFSLTTLYTDEALRISRDGDDMFYVFVRES